MVFESKLSAANVANVKAALEQRLHTHTARPVEGHRQNGGRNRRLLAANPFSDAGAQRTYAIFLDRAAPRDALDRAVGRSGEELASARARFSCTPRAEWAARS